ARVWTASLPVTREVREPPGVTRTTSVRQATCLPGTTQPAPRGSGPHGPGVDSWRATRGIHGHHGPAPGNLRGRRHADTPRRARQQVAAESVLARRQPEPDPRGGGAGHHRIARCGERFG